MKIILLSVFLLTIFFAGFSQKRCIPNLDSVLTRSHEAIIEFADSITKQELEFKTSSKDVPRFVRKTIRCWFGEFKIADVGKSFNPTDVVWNNAPRQRIKFLGINKNYMILAYEQGGIGKTDHIDLFQFKDKKILKYWSGSDYIVGKITKDNFMEHIHYSIGLKKIP
jgi:hypothetical protein